MQHDSDVTTLDLPTSDKELGAFHLNPLQGCLCNISNDGTRATHETYRGNGIKKVDLNGPHVWVASA